MMKAIKINKPGEIYVSEIPDAKWKKGYAVIEVKALGVCGSDVHAYAGKSPNVSYPLVIGHETAGIVVEVEDENRYGIKKGDRVVLDPYLYCGTCYPCSQGRTNCCEKLEVLGVQTQGSMSRYFAHPLSHMVKVPDSMTWEELAVTEPLVIALHALHSLKLKKGEHIVIIGAGAIGMLAGMAALAYGGIPIMADIVDQRLELAKTFGIKYTVNPQTEDAPGYIREVTGGRMAECVSEVSGSAAAVRNALDYAAPTGRVALTGWPNRPVELPTAVITRKELQIGGSRTGTTEEFAEAAELISTGRVPATKIISKIVSFEELPQAIAHLDACPGDWLKLIALL